MRNFHMRRHEYVGRAGRGGKEAGGARLKSRDAVASAATPGGGVRRPTSGLVVEPDAVVAGTARHFAHAATGTSAQTDRQGLRAIPGASIRNGRAFLQ